MHIFFDPESTTRAHFVKENHHHRLRGPENVIKRRLDTAPLIITIISLIGRHRV